MVDEKDLDFAVQLFFIFIAFLFIWISIPEGVLEVINNAGEVMVFLFTCSLICFSVAIGTILMTISMEFILFFLLILKKIKDYLWGKGVKNGK